MYIEEDLLPLSALQHLLFCERQCALIHIERVWRENLFTAEGRILHKRVDSDMKESRGNMRIERGVPLRSLQLGLIGKADVVEYHRDPRDDATDVWLPFPVEYKRGRPKRDNSDKVQLCAQALCLEEMLGRTISHGALFYGQKRRRFEVSFDQALRRETAETAGRLHALIARGATPKVEYSPKCDTCSLLELCLPKTTCGARSCGVKQYLEKTVNEP